MSPEEVNQRFGFHPTRSKAEEIECEALRQDYIEFVSHLNHRLPDGREKALVMTALQEAAMWSQAALAMKRPRD